MTRTTQTLDPAAIYARWNGKASAEPDHDADAQAAVEQGAPRNVAQLDTDAIYARWNSAATSPLRTTTSNPA